MKEWIIPAFVMGADALLDIRQKEIFPLLTLTGAAAGAVYTLLHGSDLSFTLLLALIPGLLLIAGSFFTKGQIGAGDGLVLLLIGAWTDPWTVWEILFFAILMAAVFAVIWWILHRRNDEIPFVPFLAGAMVSVWIGRLL